MRFGTYYFFQRPPGASDAVVIRTEVEQIVWSEALGFDSAWLTEHHFADYGISAAPSVLASAVISRTERQHVGFAVYVLPFHDPIRPVYANLSGLRALPWPRWRSARPGPHNNDGVERHFL